MLQRPMSTVLEVQEPEEEDESDADSLERKSNASRAESEWMSRITCNHVFESMTLILMLPLSSWISFQKKIRLTRS